jgi:hypothetical protein
MNKSTKSTKSGNPKQNKARRDVQSERKREYDRIAQRLNRERIRNRLSFLEDILQAYAASDRDGRISKVTEDNNDLRQQNMQLRAGMMKLKFIAEDFSMFSNPFQ